MAIQQLTLPDAAPWTPPYPTEDRERIVLSALQRRSGAQLKAELMAATGLDERSIRGAIESLRRLGWPVCSSSRTAGYWLSWDAADLEALAADYRARALSALRTRAALRRIRERRAA